MTWGPPRNQGGSAEHRILFPTGDPNRVRPNPIPRPSFEGLPPNQVYFPGGMGPVALAFFASGANRVDQREFCLVGGRGDLEIAPAPLQLEVRGIDGRLAESGQRDWRIGVRLGPNADGTSAALLRPPPPGLRRAGVGGISERFSYPGQVGYPASMDRDAWVGYSIMSGQASQSCGAQWSLLGRLGGQSMRGRGVVRKELVQWAKLGLRACCSRVTHIGAPASYVFGAIWPS